LKGSPINSLIQTIFLEERGAIDQFVHNGYELKWERANDYGLYFVAVSQNILQKNSYLPIVLQKAKATFVDLFGEKLKASSFSLPGQFNFDKQFQHILSEITLQLQEQKKRKGVENTEEI
jgi:signal recognition particle receptor subunit alpha